MANPHRGEVALVLANRHYTLRPSFQALCEIETRLACSIARLLARLCGCGLTAYEISTVLELTLQGSRMIDIPSLAPSDRQGLIESVAACLKNGLCAGDLQPLSATAGPSWAMLAATATGLCRLSPDAFWNMTKAEFMQACLEYGVHSNAMPTPAELREMMAHFPDTTL